MSDVPEKVDTELSMLKSSMKSTADEQDKYKRSIEGDESEVRRPGRKKKHNFLQLHPRLNGDIALEFVRMADERVKTQGEFLEIVFTEWKHFKTISDERN